MEKFPEMQKKIFPEKEYNEQDREAFNQIWEIWKQYRKEQHGFEYKSKISEHAAIMSLSRLSPTVDEAIERLTETMAEGWKGFKHWKPKKKENKELNGFQKAIDKLK